MPVSHHPFGEFPDRRAVTAIVLSNDAIEVTVLTLGATLHRLLVPDREGVAADILLGFDTLDGYAADTEYIGVTAGRYANRIAGARFSLDGQDFRLDANDGANHLHGGHIGLSRMVWKLVGTAENPPSARLAVASPDGSGGYPGTLDVTADFVLDGDTLTITYRATTDKPTVAGLTSHAYFNLAGVDAGASALDHLLTLSADDWTPRGPGLIPTGAIDPVAGSALDFRQPRRIASSDFDDNVAVRGPAGVLRSAARLEDPVSGRVMEIAATAPGLQFYSGGYLDGVVGKEDRAYRAGDGVCLEPQFFPDSPNQPGFPSARLDPGQTLEQVIRYRFTAR